MKISNNNIENKVCRDVGTTIKSGTLSVAETNIQDGEKKIQMSFKGLSSIAKAFVKKSTPTVVDTAVKSSDDLVKTMLSSSCTIDTVQQYAALQASEARQIALQQTQNIEKLRLLSKQIKNI